MQQDNPVLNLYHQINKGRGKTLKGYHLKYYDDTINA